MKSGKIDSQTFLLRFERGDDLLPVFKNFCKDQNIKNASFTAIGSVENPTLAHYKVDNKKYSEKKIDGVFEVTSLLGNIAILGDDILIHPHITIGDEEMHVYGGHLVQATVSATLELILTVFQSTFTKLHSEEIGLNLFNLSEEKPQTV